MPLKNETTKLLSLEFTASSALLFEEPDVLDFHAFVHGFTHVINRQRRDAASRQSFHLNTGFPLATHRCIDRDAVTTQRQINVDF